jgi:hypothetical protein
MNNKQTKSEPIYFGDWLEVSEKIMPYVIHVSWDVNGNRIMKKIYADDLKQKEEEMREK